MVLREKMHFHDYIVHSPRRLSDKMITRKSGIMTDKKKPTPFPGNDISVIKLIRSRD